MRKTIQMKHCLDQNRSTGIGRTLVKTTSAGLNYGATTIKCLGFSIVEFIIEYSAHKMFTLPTGDISSVVSDT